MTTAAKTNYGTLLQLQDSALAYNTIGEVVSVDPPEFSNPEVEATNHSSGGVREFVSSKLMEMAPFKATLNYVAADIAPYVTMLTAGTKGAYQILYPNTQKQKFSALVTSVKPLGTDAQKPDVLKIEISFRPTDSLSLSS
jgi:hypothetical protein